MGEVRQVAIFWQDAVSEPSALGLDQTSSSIHPRTLRGLLWKQYVLPPCHTGGSRDVYFVFLFEAGF